MESEEKHDMDSEGLLFVPPEETRLETGARCHPSARSMSLIAGRWSGTCAIDWSRSSHGRGYRDGTNGILEQTNMLSRMFLLS